MPMPRAARFWDIVWINACRLTSCRQGTGPRADAVFRKPYAVACLADEQNA
jgi:hypothetical protein